MVDFAVTPARTALLNVDMQNFFVLELHPESPLGLRTLERINRLADACRAAGILVIHVAHVLEPDGSNAGILADIYPAVRSEGFLNRGTTSAALHQGVVVEPGDILLEKPRYGAFHGTDLEMILRARGIDTVIIAGTGTDVCCDTTAREAHSRDFRVLFLSDGTFTHPPEAHQATLTTIGGIFGQVLTVEDVLQKIQSSAAVATA